MSDDKRELQKRIHYLETVILIADPIELGHIRNELCRRDKKTLPDKRLHERILSYYARQFIDSSYDDPDLVSELRDELLKDAPNDR